jgi:hypothetical protein
MVGADHMPRRRKPAGLEKWTWVEINAGRRMSKAEKRWNRTAKDLNWDQRSDGSYQAPPQAVPILIIMAVLMFALVIVAPNGVAHTNGDAGAIGALIFVVIAVMGVLLVLVGHNSPSSSSSNTAPPTPSPVRLSRSP